MDSYLPQTPDSAGLPPIDKPIQSGMEDDLPALVITGHRVNRRHVVLIFGEVALLSMRLFEELLELVAARFTTKTGYRLVPSSQSDLEYVRLQIHRLRRAFDDSTRPGTGAVVIETGVGTEYRLALREDDIVFDASFAELPPNLVPPQLIAQIRERLQNLKLG